MVTEAMFAKLVSALRADDVEEPSAERRGFGSSGLKVGGKLFALFTQETLVLKLPRERIDELVDSGAGARYEPRRGRVMREWIRLDGGEARWVGLAKEARRFVRGETATQKKAGPARA